MTGRMIQNKTRKSWSSQRGVVVGVKGPSWQSVISEGDWCEACGFRDMSALKSTPKGKGKPLFWPFLFHGIILKLKDKYSNTQI